MAALVAAVISLAAQRAQPPAPAAPQVLPAIEEVRPIAPPKKPLPPESESARTTRFSFIVYGDTRSGAGAVGDGAVLHPIHARVMDTMLATIKARQRTPFPVRFVLQTGDAVLRGAIARQWNVSYTPIVERLTKGAGLAYFLTAGNHDVTTLAPGEPGRTLGLNNMLTALSKLIPAEGTPRRLSGYPTYAFGYGNVFVIAFDSNVASDPVQLAWVTDQLQRLDRTRFPHVVAFIHHPPYSSGPHGGATIEPQSVALRNLYMPLFRRHHVRLVATGHEHLFEYWVERYTDGGENYRMDVMVTGGGGAPTYTYLGEPDLTAYRAAGAAQNVRVEHLVRPGATIDENPNHFVVIQVDGNRLSAEVLAAGNIPYAPFGGRATVELSD